MGLIKGGLKKLTITRIHLMFPALPKNSQNTQNSKNSKN